MVTKKEIEEKRKMFRDIDVQMASAFKVLSDINRYRIFLMLAEQPKLTVSAIARILDISLPLASQHLKVLVQANLLQKEKAGKKVFPRLEHGNPFVQIIANIIQKAPTLTK